MTSPPRPVEGACPSCGAHVEGYVRGSINLDLGEPWTDEQIEEATTVLCPGCGERITPGALIVERRPLDLDYDADAGDWIRRRNPSTG